MTPEDYDDEITLRQSAQTSRSAALVIADFYEERGQPTRARMWRRPREPVVVEPNGNEPAPDQFAKRAPWMRVDPRRDAMIWLLFGVVWPQQLARLFDASPTEIFEIVGRQNEQIAHRGYLEQQHPTMAAVTRLIAAGALRPTDDRATVSANGTILICGHTLGETPPDTWPATRDHEIQRTANTSGEVPR